MENCLRLIVKKCELIVFNERGAALSGDTEWCRSGGFYTTIRNSEGDGGEIFGVLVERGLACLKGSGDGYKECQENVLPLREYWLLSGRSEPQISD